MSQGQSSRVVVEILQTTGTVSGRMAVGEEAATEFFGWLELIDRLQSAADSSAATRTLYAIISRRGWRSTADVMAAAESSTRVTDAEVADEVRWLRSYVLEEADGSVGTLCLCEALSSDAIRRHAHRANVPVDEILRVADTIVVRADQHPAA